TWSTDEPGTSVVEFGLTGAYGSQASTAGLSQTHTTTLSGLAPETPYHFRVSSSDAAGNGPTTSGDALLTTAVSAPPAILSAPAISGVTGNGATITWATDEPATSVLEYGTTAAYGSGASTAGLATEHA